MCAPSANMVAVMMRPTPGKEGSNALFAKTKFVAAVPLNY